MQAVHSSLADSCFVPISLQAPGWAAEDLSQLTRGMAKFPWGHVRSMGDSSQVGPIGDGCDFKSETGQGSITSTLCCQLRTETQTDASQRPALGICAKNL
ncbi:hypothetical protein MATL_G00037670 [Megalops atlanticus]|uniref:Uncharacterized protein n=1 Tax=Megalops atlanticus TaxID=7932 RepID=A0A9D3TDH9_MEGAT|nr:hypothetical protein MATL_G00037670 [Megalops atlanticus]